jgi:DNA-binding MarR family transcriptional regulator
MRAVGTPDDELWRLARGAALGGVHPIRGRIIEYLVGQGEAHTTSIIAARTRLKETTVRRHLDDLVALGVLDLVQTRPEQWDASDWLRTGWSTVR